MISIIAAVSRGGVIGNDNRMPWHISEDLKHFKALTTGHPVIMGRRTFESLGGLLSNRRNIVISRKSEFCEVESAHSLEDALEMVSADDEVFVIGGGEIYRQAIKIADKLYITWVDGEWRGDTFFPEIDPKVWRRTESESHEGFEFAEYMRL